MELTRRAHGGPASVQARPEYGTQKHKSRGGTPAREIDVRNVEVVADEVVACRTGTATVCDVLGFAACGTGAGVSFGADAGFFGSVEVLVEVGITCTGAGV